MKIVNVKLKHWYQYLWPPNWRRKKTMERFMNWKLSQPEEQKMLKDAVNDYILYGKLPSAPQQDKD